MSHTTTRRSFLKAAGTSALALAGASANFGAVAMLSGCSSNSSNSSSSSSSSTAASTSGGPVSGDDHEVIVCMNTESEPSSGFDPLYSWGCGEHVHEPLIQSTLITTGTNMEFINDLATDYSVSDDGLTWTFHIRDDVKFTNGDALTAKDVAFTINGVRENEAAEADLSMVDSAKATDDYTCVLTLNKPYNSILYTLAVLGIVPADSYDAATYGANPIGSGRYVLEQWDRGQQVILAANPDYYGEAPNMERVVIVFMAEDAALAATNAAQVDIAYTQATIANSIAYPEGYGMLDCGTVDSRGVSLPCIAPGTERADGEAIYPAGNDVTCHLEVRRAINAGINRQQMVDRVLAGYGHVAYSVSDNMPWYSDAMEVAFDQSAARKYMEDAGWTEGADGIYELDGLRAAFTLHYAASDSVRQALAAEMANQLKEIGIDVTIEGGSWDELYPLEYSEPILWGWGSNSPSELYNLHYSSGWGNFACYDNDTVDAHLDAALATTTIEESYPEWQAAQWDGAQGFAPEGGASWVWLVNVDHLYYKREKLNVADQKLHPHGHGWSLVNNVDTWSWD